MSTMRHTRLLWSAATTASAGLWLMLWLASTTTSTLAAQKTVQDGVYTAAQADRGETLFGGSCASCHNPKDFTGKEFLDQWQGKPLFELFDTVKATMPMDSPGSLDAQQYADTVAYVLELNGFPAGSAELKGDDEAAMKAVTIAAK
jgi:mono/diheme cytochrome c family protein